MHKTFLISFYTSTNLIYFTFIFFMQKIYPSHLSKGLNFVLCIFLDFDLLIYKFTITMCYT